MSPPALCVPGLGLKKVHTLTQNFLWLDTEKVSLSPPFPSSLAPLQFEISDTQ